MKIKLDEEIKTYILNLTDSIAALHRTVKELVETLKCMQPPIQYPVVPTRPFNPWTYSADITYTIPVVTGDSTTWATNIPYAGENKEYIKIVYEGADRPIEPMHIYTGSAVIK